MNGKYHAFLKKDDTVFAEIYFIRGSSCHFAWHKAVELLTVLKGNTEIYLEGERYFLGEGDMFLVNSNCCHSIISQDTDNIMLALEISPDYFCKHYFMLPEGSVENLINKNRRNTVFYAKIRYFLAEIVRHAMKDTSLDEIIARDYMSVLFSELIQELPGGGRRHISRQTDKRQEAIEKAIKYIDEHYADKLTLMDVAEYVRYNKTYLSTVFKKHTGVSFKEYLSRVRLRNAIPELSNMGCSIELIALESGFMDSKTFVQLLKKYCGKTPQEYRKILTRSLGIQFQCGEDKYISYPDEQVEHLLADMLNVRFGPKVYNGNCGIDDGRQDAIIKHCTAIMEIIGRLD